MHVNISENEFEKKKREFVHIWMDKETELISAISVANLLARYCLVLLWCVRS